ncbi:MAG: hypothetical protein CVV00_12100 [Firmicutes bacterium HGW-Firmicutes-5]|nr:MAG: hypothetical protein CVV00_12100 [Firmicutes bacterium HGW-Firmicutes-5]
MDMNAALFLNNLACTYQVEKLLHKWKNLMLNPKNLRNASTNAMKKLKTVVSKHVQGVINPLFFL